MATGVSRVMTAAGLPRAMADDDGRGRVTDLRAFVKRWAYFGDDERQAMIAAAPRRHRWYDRLTHRRHDLARIAAIVHALCDRDGVAVPDWVHHHRARRPVPCVPSVDLESRWAKLVHANAPAACRYHNIWFDQTMIEDHTIHGFRQVGS